MPRKSESPVANAERLMLAYLCVKDVEGLPAQVGVLDRFGLSDSEIASVLDVAIGSVRNARHIAKKQKTKKRKEQLGGPQTAM